jgi:hypothetical protein
VHANDFPNMPPLMGLEFLWERIFYKYVAPTALGFASKLSRRKRQSETDFRSKDRAVF